MFMSHKTRHSAQCLRIPLITVYLPGLLASNCSKSHRYFHHDLAVYPPLPRVQERAAPHPQGQVQLKECGGPLQLPTRVPERALVPG
jgi:hypothetical protein